jgi:hypothetical protein
MPLQGNLSIERMCKLAKVSRASVYQSFNKQEPVEEELEVRSTNAAIPIASVVFDRYLLNRRF